MKTTLIALFALTATAQAAETKALPEGALDFRGTYEFIECSGLPADENLPPQLVLVKSEYDQNTLYLDTAPRSFVGVFNATIRNVSEKTRDSDPTECSLVEGKVKIKTVKTQSGKVPSLYAKDTIGGAICIPPFPPAWANYKKLTKELTLTPVAPASDEYTLIIKKIDGKEKTELSCKLRKVAH
jgi:hypothetical protein